jgi:Phage major capsid protein E
MPDISLLQPMVLRGVVEKLTKPESLTLSASLPKTPWPYPSVTWDVIKGSRTVAKPNVPNSEAHIVPRLGVSQQSAAFVYLREKKVFEPTTLHWLRTPGQIAGRNAEAAVLREVNDLNQRFDNFVEFCCWRAMTGTLTLDYPDVQASVNYQFAATHSGATRGTAWTTATPAQIRADIIGWKRLIARDGRVPATDAYSTEATVERVMAAYQTAGSAPSLLSDRMRDEFWRTSILPGFLGLDWHAVEQVYETDTGVVTLFVPDDALFIANPNDGRPMEIFEGPSADDEAPDGYTGKFSKTWKEKDPSARQFLLEYHMLPVITRPEQFVYVATVV